MSLTIDSSKKVIFTKKHGAVLDSKVRNGSADPSTLPRAALADFTSKIEGYFKINEDYGSGILAVKSNGVGVKPSIFASGPDGVDGDVDSGYSVMELSPPDVLQATNDDISTVPYATTLQALTGSLRNRAPSSDWPNNPIDLRMLSMFFKDGKLLVNGAIYYDGSGQNQTTSLIVDDASDLANSTITGQFGLAGAQHLTSWVVPAWEWAATLGYSHVFGSGQGLAIVSRLSAGPTMFGVSLDALFATAAGATVASNAYMDFSLEHPLSDDRLNYGGTKKGRDEGMTNNDIMTAKSNHTCGFIIPGTCTYLVLGRGSGLIPLSDAYDLPYQGSVTDQADKNGTIFYKGNVNASGQAWTGPGDAPADYVRIANIDGDTGAAGYETFDGSDVGTQYAMYDINEILAASNTYDPRPYETGYMQDLWPRTHEGLDQTGIPSGGVNPPVSPSWDEPNRRLYISLPYAEFHSGANGQTYSKKPVVAVFNFS